MLNRFYNTTRESGQLLMDFRAATARQEDILTGLFQMYGSLSPKRIEELTGYPRTSIARALRNLTIEEKITKTELKTQSRYGRPEHIWTIKR